MQSKNKEKEKLYVSFNLSDKATQKKDRQKINTIMKHMLKDSQQVESNYEEEIIYMIPIPTFVDSYDSRSFYDRLKSVFLQNNEHFPHFTKYEV